MSYEVRVVADAEDDIFDIYRYILAADSERSAEYMLKKLYEACESLSHLPERRLLR